MLLVMKPWVEAWGGTSSVMLVLSDKCDCWKLVIFDTLAGAPPFPPEAPLIVVLLAAAAAALGPPPLPPPPEGALPPLICYLKRKFGFG